MAKRGRKPNLARRAMRSRLLADGVTHTAIAREVGVSRERVNQISKDYPLPCRCGCGGLIPVAASGGRLYLPGHTHPDTKCPDCGGGKTRGAERCHPCQVATIPIPDLAGRPFGSWTVEGLVTPGVKSPSHARRWWCRCSCGAVSPVWEHNLLGDLTHGCHPCGIARRNQRWKEEREKRVRRWKEEWEKRLG